MLAEMLAVYGLGWEELLNMDVRWFCKLYSRIPVVDARRMLACLPAQTYPHLAKDSDRTRLHKRLLHQGRLAVTGGHDDGWMRLRQLGHDAESRHVAASPTPRVLPKEE